jgi:hypothetical protein
LNRFHFDNFWLGQEAFVEAVSLKWEAAASSPPRVYNAMDVWHHCAMMVHQFMQGWGVNVGAELQQKTGLLLMEIKNLDIRLDFVGLSAEEWLQRYALEDSLMEIYKGEEVF